MLQDSNHCVVVIEPFLFLSLKIEEPAKNLNNKRIAQVLSKGLHASEPSIPQ